MPDVELGDWGLPSRSDESLVLDLDQDALTAAIRVGGADLNRKISEIKIGARLHIPIGATHE